MDSWRFYFSILTKLGNLIQANNQNSLNPISQQAGGKKMANFTREKDDFMSGLKADKNKIQKITGKDIREMNEAYYWEKGISKPVPERNEGEKPAEPEKKRILGASSPEQKKRKRNKKKKNPNEVLN